MKYPISMPEEELKRRVAADWFAGFDCDRILGRVDFCVTVPATQLPLCDAESVFWAEAKKGASCDIYESFVQLVLTIGKERTHETYLPPKFLGAFDAREIAFLPYGEIFEVFVQNDFNWKVAPSDHETKEFRELYARAKGVIEAGLYRFDFERDERELRRFIKANFRLGSGAVSRIRITKNNFTHIYQKWRDLVMPTIGMPNWTLAKRNGIIDADFFLADVLSSDNLSISHRLNVLLKDDRYRQGNGKNILGQDLFSEIGFTDKQVAHRQFWNRYRRPPAKEYWDYIINRRDLLVPQDVRERKGSFFTPRKWVELSQDYLRRELGEDWQDEYVVWDCCAGTGNLEAGLTNKYNVWASTLDLQDVDAMRQRIVNGANLLDDHVFQFDFLNDPFDKLPPKLKAIIDDPERRKKLVIYINPPYAEASNAYGIVGTGTNRIGISQSLVKVRYDNELGRAANELFAQFFARIVRELKGVTLGMFSKLKILQAPNFQSFRELFAAKMMRMFVAPANTFDNVSGHFPIGFQIWRTGVVEIFRETDADVYDSTGQYIGKKTVMSYAGYKYLIDWFRQYYDKRGEQYAYLRYLGTDFQHNNGVFITLKPSKTDLEQVKGTWVTPRNIIESCVYFSVRLCIAAMWLNDRDQFLSPNEKWKVDAEFLGDCVVFTLFHTQNRISTENGVNHWIPFTESEVGARDCFASHFMSDFLAGKIKVKRDDLFAADETRKFEISPAAKAVLDAGRELWRYYHAQPNANPDASYYDIRRHFQGVKTTASGKEQMNATSADATYNERLAALKTAMKALAAQIAPKVYEYGFLKR